MLLAVSTPLSAACVQRCLLWLFCMDGNCVSIRVTEGEESPKRSIGRREKDGYVFLHQLRVERIGIRCGDPKRHPPSQLAGCIEVNHRCSDRKRDRLGVEDNRSRSSMKGTSTNMAPEHPMADRL